MASVFTDLLNKGALGKVKELSQKEPSTPSPTPIADVLRTIAKTTAPIRGTAQNIVKGSEEAYTAVKKAIPSVPIVGDVVGMAAGVPGEVAKALTNLVGNIGETGLDVVTQGLAGVTGGVETAVDTFKKGRKELAKIIEEGNKAPIGSKARSEAATKLVTTPFRIATQSGIQTAGAAYGALAGLTEIPQSIETGLRGVQAGPSLTEQAIESIDIGGKAKAGVEGILRSYTSLKDEDIAFIGDLASFLPDLALAGAGKIVHGLRGAKSAKVDAFAKESAVRENIHNSVRKILTTEPEVGASQYTRLVNDEVQKLLNYKNSNIREKLLLEKLTESTVDDVARNKNVAPEYQMALKQEREFPDLVEKDKSGMTPSENVLLNKARTQGLTDDEINALTKTDSRIPKTPQEEAFFDMAKDMSPEELQKMPRSFWQRFRTDYQDRLSALKELSTNKALKIQEAIPIYKELRNFEGKKGAIEENIARSHKEYYKKLDTDAKILSIPTEQLSKDIREYAQALHTPESYKLGKETDISLEKAIENKARIEQLPYIETVKKFTKEIQDVGREQLRLLYDNGLVDGKTFNTLSEVYKNYVPFFKEGQLDTKKGGTLGKGKALSARSKSDRKVVDIIENAFFGLQDARLRVEANNIKKRIYNFTEEFPDNGLFKIIKNPTLKDKEIVVVKDGEVSFKKTIPADKNTVVGFKDGKPFGIQVGDDGVYEALAMTPTHIGPIFSALGAITRTFGALKTKSLDFLGVQKIRDIQDSLLITAAEKDIGYKGVGKTVLKMIKAEGERAVIDWMKGKDTPLAKKYQEVLDKGGEITGYASYTRKNIVEDLNKAAKAYESGNFNKGKWNVIKWLDNISRTMEGGTRYAKYYAAKEMGLSDTDAAFSSRDYMDFNLKGRKISKPASFILFLNPNIQGAKKAIDVLKNPKVFIPGTIAAYNVYGAVDMWNSSFDEEWKKDFSDEQLVTDIRIAYGKEQDGSIKYIPIPVGFIARPMLALAKEMYTAQKGEMKNVGKSTGNILASFANTAAPLLNASDPLRPFLPSIIQSSYDAFLKGTDRYGRPIAPDGDIAEREKYWKSLEDKPLGKAYIEAAKIIAGVGGDISPSKIDYIMGDLMGGMGKNIVQTGKIISDVATTGQYQGKPEGIPGIGRFFQTADIEKRKYREQSAKIEEFISQIDLLPLKERKKKTQDFLDAQAKDDRKGILYILGKRGLDTKGLTIKDEDKRPNLSPEKKEAKDKATTAKKINRTYKLKLTPDQIESIYNVYTKAHDKYSYNEAIKRMSENETYRNNGITKDVIVDVIKAFE